MGATLKVQIPKKYFVTNSCSTKHEGYIVFVNCLFLCLLVLFIVGIFADYACGKRKTSKCIQMYLHSDLKRLGK